MPLKEEDIQPGRCYGTRGPESYRVLAITRGIVTYQTLTSPLRINVGVRQFAEAVHREIACPGPA